MKKILTPVLAVMILAISVSGWAATAEQNLDMAHKINRQTWLNNTTDSMATMGKDPAHAAAIRRERKKARALDRRQKEMDRRMKDTKKKLDHRGYHRSK